LFQIEVESIDWINKAPKNIPFYIKDFNEGKEALRMQVRFFFNFFLFPVFKLFYD